MHAGQRVTTTSISPSAARSRTRCHPSRWSGSGSPYGSNDLRHHGQTAGGSEGAPLMKGPLLGVPNRPWGAGRARTAPHVARSPLRLPGGAQRRGDLERAPVRRPFDAAADRDEPRDGVLGVRVGVRGYGARRMPVRPVAVSSTWRPSHGCARWPRPSRTLSAVTAHPQNPATRATWRCPTEWGRRGGR